MIVFVRTSQEVKIVYSIPVCTFIAKMNMASVNIYDDVIYEAIW